jgi:hypothetical protein
MFYSLISSTIKEEITPEIKLYYEGMIMEDLEALMADMKSKK